MRLIETLMHIQGFATEEREVAFIEYQTGDASMGFAGSKGCM
jgi:hypothetical protein